MTTQEFIEKWGYQPADGYGNARLDCRDALRRDLQSLSPKPNACPRCNGDGRINSLTPDYPPYPQIIACPDCKGTGKPPKPEQP